MSASSVGRSVPRPMTRLNVLRALLKAFGLFLLFNLAYRTVQPVQMGTLPTLYNTIVPGVVRPLWGPQTNAPLLLNNHIIQRASDKTWNIIMLGSSETFGWPDVPEMTTPGYLDAWGLQTAEGRPVRAYNFGVPSGDAWKDLIVAEQVLQAGLPVDMIVLNTFSYAFENETSHIMVVKNPTLARTVVEKYDLPLFYLDYIPYLGIPTFLTERFTLGAWVNDQINAFRWQTTRRDRFDINVAQPLTAFLGPNKNYPITREGFVRAFRLMAERYQVDLLIINVPRPIEEDTFNAWLTREAADNQVALLDCEFVFDDPGMFFDSIHFMPETYSLYARILAQHFSRAEMSAVSSAFPLHLPADFVAPEESCVFSPVL